MGERLRIDRLVSEPEKGPSRTFDPRVDISITDKHRMLAEAGNPKVNSMEVLRDLSVLDIDIAPAVEENKDDLLNKLSRQIQSHVSNDIPSWHTLADRAASSSQIGLGVSWQPSPMYVASYISENVREGRFILALNAASRANILGVQDGPDESDKLVLKEKCENLLSDGEFREAGYSAKARLAGISVDRDLIPWPKYRDRFDELLSEDKLREAAQFAYSLAILASDKVEITDEGKLNLTWPDLPEEVDDAPQPRKF